MLALRDFTLEVEDREFSVLLGPSGCGKTTALRIVAGVEELSGGDVYIGDRRVNDVAAKDRDLAMVFQNYALYPHMTVYANLTFGLRMRKHSRSEMDRLARDAAEKLGITELLDRRPGQLSGGQQQRVALGRAIVRRPQVFLMDEPLSNLDSKMRVQMRAELIRLHRELGTTFIFVTHDQVEAMTMGQRMAVLDDGVLQQVGAPQEVYDRPANLFVAEFIGSPAMNFFEGSAAQTDDGTALQTADGLVGLPPAVAQALRTAHAQSFILGIRPEHLVLATGDAAGMAATFEGEVDVVEALGSEQHVTISLAHSSLVARMPATMQFKHGTTIRLAVAPEHVHVFDGDTKERIQP